jgi:hypothetical protein
MNNKLARFTLTEAVRARTIYFYNGKLS